MTALNITWAKLEIIAEKELASRLRAEWKCAGADVYDQHLS